VQTSRLPLASPVEKLSFIDVRVADRVDGVLRQKLLDGRFDDRDLQAVSAEVLMANREELGLSQEILLRHDKSEFHSTVARSRYRQVARLQDGTVVPVFNAGVEVLYGYDADRQLVLSQIKQIVYRAIPTFERATVPLAAIDESAKRTMTAVALHLDRGGRTARQLFPFAVSGVDSLELGVWVKNGAAYLTCQVRVLGEYPSGKQGSFVGWFDARSAELLDYHSTSLNALQQRGIAEVYYPNPIENPLKVDHDIFNLQGNLHLYGEYAEVHTHPALGDAVGTVVNSIEEYRFFSAPVPQNRHTAETCAYNTINKRKYYLNTTGFPSLMNFSIHVEAIDGDHFSSEYDPDTKTIYLDSAVIDAYDSDVTMHEYGHAIHHDIGGLWSYGYPFNYVDEINGAMDEGSCDYMAVSTNNDLELAEYALSSLPPLRTANSSKNAIDNLSYSHANGEIWSSAFYSLRKAIGKGIADRIALQFVYHVLPTDDFNSALETAIMPAIQDLYPGDTSISEIIRKVLSLHKINGSQPQRTWTTDFLMSERPYGKNYAETKSYTVPGAAAVIAIFDVYTKVNENDAIVITDGGDVPIPGSPFLGDTLRGRMVRAPGDTIKVTLNSSTADNLGGYGYLITSIAAEDPSNQSPGASPVVTPQGKMEPLIVTFDLTSAFDNDGYPVAYSVDPGDGSQVIHMDPSLPRAVHIYNMEGMLPITVPKTFTAIMTVMDEEGGTSTFTQDIRVIPHVELQDEPSPAMNRMSGPPKPL